MPLVLLSIFLFVRATVTELIKNSILLSESEITSSYDLSFFSYFPVISYSVLNEFNIFRLVIFSL